MKFFGWMQSKLNGKQASEKPSTSPPTRLVKQESREEFSDWPHGLLAIGTFGNNNNDAKQNQEIQEAENDQHHHEEEEEGGGTSPPSDDLQDFTAEEIVNLQKELTKLLSKKPTSEVANLPLDRFLNCPSSLEISRRMSNVLTSDRVDDDQKEDDIERTISIILGRCKDICESKKRSIGRKSVTFLLKKMFACRAGFAPQPSLRDTFQESRMEKLLRTLLHKKINPQNTPRASSMKKFLGDRVTSNKETEQENRAKTADGSKWVKTDSEYIVLEI